MSEPKDQSCDNCRFYVRQQCHRFPPCRESGLGGIGGWHGVRSHDWCGEWQKADDK